MDTPEEWTEENFAHLLGRLLDRYRYLQSLQDSGDVMKNSPPTEPVREDQTRQAKTERPPREAASHHASDVEEKRLEKKQTFLSPSGIQGPSVEEWVLGTLQERGPQTLDQFGASLPQANWAQLLLAIDRLTRQGEISMRIHGHGDYLIALTPSVPTGAPRRAA